MQNSRLVEIAAGRCRHGIMDGAYCEKCHYLARADRRLLWMMGAGIAVFALLILLIATATYAQAPSPAKPPVTSAKPAQTELPPMPQGRNISATPESITTIGRQQLLIESQGDLINQWQAWGKQVEEIVNATPCKPEMPTPPAKPGR